MKPAPKFLTVVMAIAALALATPATAQIPAGFDLWQTSPEDTVFNFDSAPVPPNFFGPGSDPFLQPAHFGGVPLHSFPGLPGADLGDTDTIVRRPDPANPAPSDTVPIEIVALSLRSVQPITVTFNGGQNPTLYDVDVSLSTLRGPPANTGQITIHAPLTGNNTFDSQLLVIPVFRFEKISGFSGAVQSQTFDVGNLEPGPQRDQFDEWMTFNQSDGPWAYYCMPPALVISGNDIFCPGLIEEPPVYRKALTVEQAALARHGVYPAQPALEHFKCYETGRAAFKRRKASIANQFGTDRVRVTARKELCNPAQKKAEPFVNKRAHQQCYAIRGKAVNVPVAVQNQFGTQLLQVVEPKRLCVPSQKRELRKRFRRIRDDERIDHQTCYSVKALSPVRDSGRGKPGRVTLTDQFRKERVALSRTRWLCAPTDKNDEGLNHPVDHLVCYGARGKRRNPKVEIKNQFERKRLKVLRPASLCVPSNKVQLPG